MTCCFLKLLRRRNASGINFSRRNFFIERQKLTMNISFHVLVSVLIWQKKGLLLLRRRRNFKDIDTGRGLWELPGGKRDDGEWPSETALREIREETGWQVRKKLRWRTMFLYHLKTPEGLSYRWQLLYNLRISDKQHTTIFLGEEHDDFKFVQTAEELEKLPMLPTIKRYLLVALTGKVWLKLEERPREGTF